MYVRNSLEAWLAGSLCLYLVFAMTVNVNSHGAEDLRQPQENRTTLLSLGWKPPLHDLHVFGWKPTEPVQNLHLRHEKHRAAAAHTGQLAWWEMLRASNISSMYVRTFFSDNGERMEKLRAGWMHD